MTTLRLGLPLAVLFAIVPLLAPPPASGQDELPPDPPAVGLRVTLARSLGEHALLLGDVVRSALAGASDFEAAAAALEANSADIIGAIEGVYGEEAGGTFAEQWNRHVASIIDYSRAVAEGDAGAAELAAEQLDRYVEEFSGFLAAAMPVLPASTVEGLIGEHVQQLEHVASFDARDFDGAYGAMRDTYHHMFEVGDGLTLGIVSVLPERFPGRAQAFGPATTLRIGLDRLLGEHTYLASFAMRAILRGSSDADGAADALQANSSELRATIAGLYGDAAAAAFAELWDGHVSAYVDYVVAVQTGDEAASSAALNSLRTYRSDFSSYVAGANPFVDAANLEALIGSHSDHLVAQADAYAAGDTEVSYTIGREAYAHAGVLAAQLAAGIADQFPVLFPDTALVGPPPTSKLSTSGAITLVALFVLTIALSRAWIRARFEDPRSAGWRGPGSPPS